MGIYTQLKNFFDDSLISIFDSGNETKFGTNESGTAKTDSMIHDGVSGGYGSNPFYAQSNFQNLFGQFIGTRIDYRREVGDLSQSSLVMAAVNWLGLTLPEAPIQTVKKMRNGKKEIQIDHPLTRLLEQPNKFFSGELLWKAFSLSWFISGNVYWYKVRNALGEPIELWCLPHFAVEPRWNPSNPNSFIDYYAYRTTNGEYQLSPDDVVHFRNGIDPNNTRVGLSPLAAGLREIYSDNEAANFSALLMRNCGVPMISISPKEGVDQLKTDFRAIQETYQRRTTGDERGKPIVNPIGVTVEKLSFNPDELDLSKLRRIPEERIAALLRIPAIVLQFGAGLERATYSNYAEAREASYEEHVVPLQRYLVGEMRRQILVDFQNSEKFYLEFDLSDVRVLQDDQDKLFTRLTTAYKGNWMKRGEVRSRIGLETDEADNIYFTPTARTDDEKITDGDGKTDTVKP